MNRIHDLRREYKLLVMVKKILKFLLIFLGGVIIALALLPFVFEDEIKEGLKQAINEQVNAKVDFEDINLSFFRSFPDASVRVDQILVTGVDRFENDTLLSVEKMDLSVALLSLFKKSTPIEINEVLINQANARLYVDRDLNTNYLIFKESDTQNQFAIELEKYSIEHSSLSYMNESNDIDIVLKDINHTGKGKFTESLYDLDTRTSSPDFSVSRLGIPLFTNAVIEADAIIEVRAEEEKFTFRDNKITLNALPFSMDGYVKLLESGTEMDLNFLAPDSDFATLFSLIPYAYTKDYKDAKINGNGTLAASIKGIMATDNSTVPAVGIDLNISNGSIKYPLLPAAIEDVVAIASIKASGENYNNLDIDVPSIRLKVKDDLVSGRARINGSLESQNIDMGLNVNLDLKNWKDAFPMQDISKLEGKIKSDIQLKGNTSSMKKKKWNEVILDGYINLQNFKVEGSEMPVVAISNLSGSFSPANATMEIDDLVYEGSDFDVDVEWRTPLSYLTENKLIASLKAQSNKLNFNDFMTEASTETSSNSFQFPELDIDFEYAAQQILYEDYNTNNLIVSGSMKGNRLTINQGSGSINGNNIRATSQLDGVIDYFNNLGPVSGNITVNSPLIDTRTLMQAASRQQAEYASFSIPQNVQLGFNSNIDKVIHEGYTLNKVNVSGRLANQIIEIENFESSSMGGVITAAGSYSAVDNSNPAFDFKLDLSRIGFREAVESSPLFKYLAPVAGYIEGYFNATLMMNSEVGLDFAPVYSTLDASGFIETREGKIQGFTPMTNLGQKFGVDEISNWAIKNSKNWFEVVDGMVELKDHRFELGKGLALTIGGRHGLGKDMSYNMILELPRSLLKSNAVTGTLEYGLSQVEAQAARLGVDISQGDNLLFNIGMTGKINDPTFKITPLGSIDRGLDEIADEKLKEKIAEMEDKINAQIESTTTTVKDSLERVKKKATDSVTQVITKGVDTVKDSLGKVVENTKKKAVDSLLNKTGLDSLNAVPVDILKDKAGKEIDDIKKKLDKWKPFSAKPKSKKDTIPKGGF